MLKKTNFPHMQIFLPHDWFFCKLSRNPFLMDDLLIISALDDTQTHKEGNSLCFTFKSIMESKTSVLRVKI